MSSEAPSESELLLPYLNPEYWDGHMLGSGETEEPLVVSPLAQSHRDAKQMMAERIARLAKAVPLETFKEGEVFDARDYDIGTLVILREEKLILDILAKQLELPDVPTGLPLPARPMDTSPNFEVTEPATDMISNGNVAYVSRPMWGIVTNSRRHGHIIYDTSAGSVYRRRKGGIEMISSVLNERSPIIETGKTRHYKHRSEWLERVNILDVVAYGDTQRQRSVRSIAGRLGFRTGEA